MMKKRRRWKASKLDIIRQSKPREKMPRPAVFRNRKKFDRNMMKQDLKKEMDPQ